MARTLEPTFEGDFTLDSFRLDSGVELRPAVLHYAVYGELNAERSNAVLVCHALSGSARVADWWGELFAELQDKAEDAGRALFSLKRDCIIGVNIFGSCYGSSGPKSVNPATGQQWGPDFPQVTIRDTVRAQAALMDELGIARLRVAIGGSIGGMQAMEWAINYPERVGTCVSIGAARLGALGLALNHLQRQMIQIDPDYRDGRYDEGQGPKRGIALARGLAMCTYKSAELFEERYARKPNRNGEDPFETKQGRFDVAGYLDYQGELFKRRFEANSYIAITKTMDTFDFSRGYRSDKEALRRIKAEVVMVGISSDWLFPATDVRKLADDMVAAGVDCRYVEQISDHGHDAFLAEPHELEKLIGPVVRGGNEFQRFVSLVCDAPESEGVAAAQAVVSPAD